MVVDDRSGHGYWLANADGSVFALRRREVSRLGGRRGTSRSRSRRWPRRRPVTGTGSRPAPAGSFPSATRARTARPARLNQPILEMTPHAVGPRLLAPRLRRRHLHLRRRALLRLDRRHPPQPTDRRDGGDRHTARATGWSRVTAGSSRSATRASTARPAASTSTNPSSGWPSAARLCGEHGTRAGVHVARHGAVSSLRGWGTEHGRGRFREHGRARSDRGRAGDLPPSRRLDRRLVAEPGGRVSEVHVVAHPGKHPKQIARDVQSIALGVVRARARPPHHLGRAARRRRARLPGLAGVTCSGRRSSRSPPRPTACARSCGSRSPATTRKRSGSPEGSIATTARHRLVADRDGRRAAPARARRRVHRHRQRRRSCGSTRTTSRSSPSCS